MTFYSAELISYYFIQKANQEKIGLSNLRLQRLLYYAQGYHLAIYQTPLFPSPLVAYSSGSIVPEIQHRYHNQQNLQLDKDNVSNQLESIIDEQTQKLLNQIFHIYMAYSDWALRRLLHEDKPWLHTVVNEVINLTHLKKCFRAKIKNLDLTAFGKPNKRSQKKQLPAAAVEIDTIAKTNAVIKLQVPKNLTLPIRKKDRPRKQSVHEHTLTTTNFEQQVSPPASLPKRRGRPSKNKAE